MRNIYILIALITISLFAGSVEARKPSDIHTWSVSSYDLKHLKTALREYGRGNWQSKILRDYNPRDPVIQKILKWKEYVSASPGTNFNEITEFIRYNPNWPFQETLRENAESAITSVTDPDDIIKWFAINAPILDSKIRFKKPLTAYGKRMLAEAMIKRSNKYKIDKSLIVTLIKEAYVETNFNPKTEKQFLSRYWKILTQKDHRLRVDRLLTDRRITDATRIVKYLDKGYKRIFEARKRLIRDKPGVDQAIAAVPPHLRNDSGLVYERVKWRHRRGREEDVIELIRKLPKNVTHPENWWGLRKLYIRKLIKQERYMDAYYLARYHSFKANRYKIAEAEWFAGWLSHSFINNYTQAFKHFKNIYNVAETPISLARANYWMGRSLEAKGQKPAADRWYRNAAKFQATFYGQLASIKIGKDEFDFPIPSSVSNRDLKAYRNNEVAKAASIMMQIGYNRYGKHFLKKASEQAQSPGERILVAPSELLKEFTVRTVK